VTLPTVDSLSAMVYSDSMNKRKDMAEAVRMYERGLSIEDVARAYGVTRQSMWKCLRRRGVSFRPRERSGKANHFYRGGSARNITWVASKAISRGILVVGPCEVCGLSPAVEGGRQRICAHHDDYNFPLAVRWLCADHHREWHSTHRAVSKTGPSRSASEVGRIGGLAAQAKLTPEQRRIAMAHARASRS